MSAVSLNAELPRDDEAEIAVLGAIVVQNERLADVATILQPEHFRQKWAEIVFRGMLTLAKVDKPIDYITLKNAIDGDALKDLVGVSRLAKLGDGVPRGTNVEHYARVVLDHWRRRETIHKALQVIESALEHGSEADDVIAEAQERFFRLAQTKRQETLFSAAEMTDDLVKHFDDVTEKEHGATGITTGIVDLDLLSFGLQPGELVVLGARPGVGKTALALQMALHMASEAPGLFCSLEMDHRSVWKRALFNTARVNGFAFLRGRLTDPGTHRRISRALEVLRPLPLWIDEQPGMTSLDIRSKAQQVKLRHGLGFVIVDYLQLMRATDQKAARTQTRAQIVGEMARDLKDLARSLGVPVVVLSGLRRLEADRMPTMEDLRESGDIEAHADVVLLLHSTQTPEQIKELQAGEPAQMDLVVAKQRGNPTGVVHLSNFREEYRFAKAIEAGPENRALSYEG